MITIIHGEDILSSRKFYIDERKKSEYPIILFGDNINLTNLAQTLKSNSLFDIRDKSIFIEDLFLKKKSKELDNILLFIEKHSQSVDITIWESKEIPKRQLSSLDKTSIKLFSLPKSIFLFLNEIRPKNGKILINFFHKTIGNLEVELVFYMLTRQIRLMLAVLDKASINKIDEIKNIPSWQAAKLEKQALCFSNENLIKIHSKICSIDISQKTGNGILSLSQAIDFLLLSI